jgi:hypothetical protein
MSITEAGKESEFFILAKALCAFKTGLLDDDPSDRALARAARVSPTTIAGWLRGKRFPQDVGKVLIVVRMVRDAAARRRIASPGSGPAGLLDEDRWRAAHQEEAQRRAGTLSDVVQRAQAISVLAGPPDSISMMRENSGAHPSPQPGWRWDVALSFAGTQRDYVEQVAQALQVRGVRCFYDADEQIELWGKYLAEELPAIYGEQAAAVVVFVSAEYAIRDWTRLERRAALARAVHERREYVLPARFDDTPLPGPLSDMVTVDLRSRTPQQFAAMIAGKLAALGIVVPVPPTDARYPPPLPESLQAALDSPHPSIRIAAVTELGAWLTGGDPARAVTARRHLQEVADTDIPQVAQTACTVLNTRTVTEPSTAAPQAMPMPTRLRKDSPPHQAGARAPQPSPTPVLVPPSHLARTLTGHTGGVYGVAFSPDGLLATASLDKTAQVWDPGSGDCLRTLTGHTSGVWAVAFSPDGRMLATASPDKTARLWDPATGDCLRTLTGHTSHANGVAFSQDGRLLATASDDETARLWNPATGDCLRTLTGHANTVWAVAFSPDGRMLATASDDQTARLWNPATGDCLRTLTGHANTVWAVAFSPDGRLLATASPDKTARLWDPATGDCLRTLTGHTRQVNGVAFSADGRLLVTASDDKSAQLWD